MFEKIVDSISRDFVSLSLITFAALYLVYMVVVRVHVYMYQKKNDKKPVHYRMFRMYSKSLINNSPSKRDKQFYIVTNRITWFFNTVVILSFVIYLIIVFR